MKPYFQPKWISQILPGFISLAGVGLYILLAWGHAHGQVSVIDEGLYLYKGYLYATGEYVPFQDYGPLTNHMPLSFLIPGFFQTIFGAGIWTGRLMAIGLAICMLLGLWLASRRLVGSWWAAAAVWFITLNSMLIKIYSQAVSQVLVACLLIWVVVLTAGKNRDRWQILAGVVLSALLFLTRINMAPVLLIAIPFIYWQHGRKVGRLALVVAVIIVAVGHVIYWPGILKLWAKWIPESISPFLNSFRLPPDAIPLWDPNIDPINRYESLLLTLKIHYISFLGFLAMIAILISKKKRHLVEGDDVSAWFMVSLFGVLFIAHAVASLGLNYCVYCLRNYVAFFSPIGIILVGMFGRELGKIRSSPPIIYALIFLLIIPFFFGFSLDQRLIESILTTDITKVSSLTAQLGTTEIRVMLGNKLGVQYGQLIQLGQLFVLAILALVPTVTILVCVNKGKSFLRDESVRYHYSIIGLGALLIVEMIFTTLAFSSSYGDYDCGEDVVAANASVGTYLSEKIPRGSRIYWGVGRSPVPLLYLPDRQVFPSQLNGDYTYMLSGESQALERFGYWDSQLARSWLFEADYVLVEERVYSDIHSLGFDEKRYDEITRTPLTNPCRADSSIMIFRNLQGLE